MMGKTHLIFGLLVGLGYVIIVKPAHTLPFILIVMFFSLLPDIDNSSSILGRKTKIFAFLFKHRGLFHSFFMLILFPLLAFVFLEEWIAYAIFLGYGSHMLLDALTRHGIMPLMPFHRMHIKGFMKTGGWLETIFMISLFVIIIILALLNKNIFISLGFL